ncbi:MAG TPA: dienelactone hydrolase family protein [Noviherbaspirillum sp.]|jgi:dienelactone hydrolase|uniref:dienelactone hydrolase family protein n=1 Tax=Noviherbaspirillum sp. TaxID=1926288 RepID=UPI002DDCFAD5|nr:dienelactone hydrolase family protein [Noviherbaspirillum sp.]HEV2610629.1 dienelactone hydrolase family protein [Noviherbaspirillum sp.]
MRPSTFILLLAAALSSVAAGAEPPHPGARQVVIHSQGNDGPVSLASWWIGAGKNGRLPVIIALHGCGGLYGTAGNKQKVFSGRHAAMADLLQDAGYHVLWLDSFSSRGKQSICTEKFSRRDISVADRRADVHAALRWVAARPEVDAARIALLGWSNGGSTVLSSIDAGHTDVSSNTVRPAAAVAFYPGCTAFARDAGYRNATPLLILMGEKDDWTPPDACVALERKLDAASAGAPVALRLYPDSFHNFDAPGLPVRRRLDVPNGVRPGEGVTSGGNPAAREDAYRELFAFLKKHLEQP